MIGIDRGPPPPCLALVRASERRRVLAQHRRGAPLEIGDRYNHPEVREALYRTQGWMCCYCEIIIPLKGSPLEHLRPKKRALRGRGRPTLGYFWLAWDWDNLFLACTACNHTKGTKFRLARRSGVLQVGASPPGPERPMLIDPSVEDPVAKIRFKRLCGHWRPIPRVQSSRAKWTIREIGLDAPERLAKYDAYVREQITPLTRTIKARLRANDAGGARAAWKKAIGMLFGRTAPFKALAHDVLDARFPRALREQWKLVLRRP